MTLPRSDTRAQPINTRRETRPRWMGGAGSGWDEARGSPGFSPGPGPTAGGLGPLVGGGWEDLGGGGEAGVDTWA